jgi:spore coat protein A
MWLLVVLALCGDAHRMAAPRVSSWAQAVPKFVTPLSIPATYVPVSGAGNYTVTMSEFFSQILPAGYPATRVWGYGGMTSSGFVQSYPGPSFDVQRGQEALVKFVNNISTPHLFQVDPTLHWANPNNAPHPSFPFLNVAGNLTYLQPVPLIAHLHGLEHGSASDGHPEAWWTYDGKQGPTYSSPGGTAAANAAIFRYPNQQPPATLWYHDHALGLTRLNVMAGLAGFYILRDPADTIASTLLPNGAYDVPLMLQDRMFNETDGSLLLPSDYENPAVHPFWRMQFLGDVICVNGRAWPNLNVNKGQYMFRLLNGANARFFNVSLQTGATTLAFTVIGTDSGYLRSPVPATSLLMGPGDRSTILVDFSGLATGATVVMRNAAPAPYDQGEMPDPMSTELVMQFTVQAAAGFAAKTLPAILNSALATYPSLPAATKQRVMVLYTDDDATTGLTNRLMLNGLPWMAPVSEYAVVGTTEEWTIVNIAADVHPIHVHLAAFQVIKRQSIDLFSYRNAWLAVNGPQPFSNAFEVDPTPYLIGNATLTDPVEQGFQDAVNVGSEVVTFRLRFSPIDGSVSYPFDPTAGPGYVWHCHILDHEDNDMMRPLQVVDSSFVPPTTATRTTVATTTAAPTTTAAAVVRNCTTLVVTTSSAAFVPNIISAQIGDTISVVFGTATYHLVDSVPDIFSCTPDLTYSSGMPHRSPYVYTLPLNANNGFTNPTKQYHFVCSIHCFFGMRAIIEMNGVCDPSALLLTTTPAPTTTTTTAAPVAATTTSRAPNATSAPALAAAMVPFAILLVVTNIFFAIV